MRVNSSGATIPILIVTVHRFRVKEKEGIEDPKSSSKMLIFPNNCQFSSKFWIRSDEAEDFFVNS